MNLWAITLTGADDSVWPEQLADISEVQPLIEWGILASRNSMGGSRFPARKWLDDFCDVLREYPETRRSLHLCGSWLRQLLRGDLLGMLAEIGSGVWDAFPRVQLNFHGEELHVDRERFFASLAQFPEKEFIFQIDGNMGLDLLYGYFEREHGNAAPLFDVSHGAGVSPREWPAPIFMQTDAEHSRHGYAGGLGPDNIKAELERISAAAGGCELWIDMETKIRSNNGEQFNLEKCRFCVEQTLEFMESAASK